MAEPAFKRESVAADRWTLWQDSNRSEVLGRRRLGLLHNRGRHGAVLMECDISHGILGNCFATWRDRDMAWEKEKRMEAVWCGKLNYTHTRRTPSTPPNIARDYTRFSVKWQLCMMMMQDDVFTNRYFIMFIYMVDSQFMRHHPSWQRKLRGIVSIMVCCYNTKVMDDLPTRSTTRHEYPNSLSYQLTSCNRHD